MDELDKKLKQPKGMQNLHRIFVALTDWQPGWMWQFGTDHWCNWKKGDVIKFDWRNVPHSTANAGYSARSILKITGTSDFVEKNKKLISENQKKSFFYIGGITEGFETILCFIMMLLFYEYIKYTAYIFGTLCWITFITRVIFIRKLLKS